jgi:long-chain acyl-CoA synthetase
MPRANLIFLLDSFLKMGAKTAVVETRGYRMEKLTYAQLSAAVLARSHSLRGLGIGPGDRVLLWGPNSSSWVACFWAILLRGAVAVPMDAAASLDFVRRTVLDAEVKLILRDRRQLELFSGPPSTVINDFHEVRETPQLADRPVDPGDSSARSTIAEILFTSGTTSDPRGVVLTHGNFLANLEPLEQGIAEYRNCERWVRPLRFVSLVPLSHVFGQFMALFVPPLLGATVVFENSPHPAEILRTLKRERATALVAVPRMLDALRNALEHEIDTHGWRDWFTAAYSAADGEPFSRRVWRFRRLHRRFGWKFWAFISGGAALSSETEAFFRRIGYAVVQGYGMTETASLISLNHPFHAAQGSVGKILPGREFRLAEDGEILVRGENVASSYWQGGAMREAAQETDGWLSTGDLGELDAQGNLFFRGRKKSVIVTPAGLNIHPEDLEQALRKQPGIRDAVVIPTESGRNLEPCAVLLLAPEQAPARSARPDSPDSIAQKAVDAANSTLAQYQRIRHWLLWPDPDFPRTATGKPRLALIAEGAVKQLSVPAGSDSRSSASFTPFPSLPSSLKDLSSLDRVELLSTLEQRYNLELNETQFANAQTADDLKQLLAQPAARRSDYVYPRWPQSGVVRLFRLLVYYALAWPATMILAHPKIIGRQNLDPLEGPALIVANHTTRRADIGLVLFALPARFRHRLATAMGGEYLREFRHPPREWFFAKRWLWRLNYFLVVSLFNVFPLPQFSGFRESFRFAGESADRGYSILVFPEGVINDRATAAMAPFQEGIGLLAQNLQIPIVPLRLDGVWQMKQEGRRLAHRNELSVHVGVPVSFPPGTPPAEIAAHLQALLRWL